MLLLLINCKLKSCVTKGKIKKRESMLLWEELEICVIMQKKETHFTFCFFTSLQFILSDLIPVFLLSPIVLLEISVYLFSICKECRFRGLIWVMQCCLAAVGTGNVFRGGVWEGTFPTTVKFDPKTQNSCNSKNVVAVVQGFLSKTHLNILSPVVCTCVCLCW